MNETKFIFDSADQWHGRGEERILCPNVTFDNSSSGKMTKRKMEAGMNLRLFQSGTKPFKKLIK